MWTLPMTIKKKERGGGEGRTKINMGNDRIRTVEIMTMMGMVMREGRGEREKKEIEERASLLEGASH